MTTADFLFEIHCEELPPKALNALRESLQNSFATQLNSQQLSFKELKSFATPRRLAVLVSGLQTQQADQVIQKRGPALSQAYDAQGNPSKACLGFLKSCSAELKDLKTLKTDQGEWVVCEQHITGKDTAVLLPEIIQQAIKELPVPKWMRWGNHTESFARPVHSIILMQDDHIIDATILGLKTGRVTQGHRFLCKAPLEITHAKDYEKILEERGFVIADYAKRQQRIRKQIKEIEEQENLTSSIDDKYALLEEVTSLVEWPTARLASFDKRFLEIPDVVLICSMQEHQKCFPLQDAHGKLNHHFIFISNISPDDWTATTQGNQKVMAARLSDAKFFYDTDLKYPLESLVDKLSNVSFQKNLGNLHDKAKRLFRTCSSILLSMTDRLDPRELSIMLHHKEKEDIEEYSRKEINQLIEEVSEKVGNFAKTDLLSHMVVEFPELQGIMGYHYALHDHQSQDLANALREQYLPRFANDEVAHSPLGIALSIADKLDNLVGSFGINQIPTGNKDPFALRRAAIGIIRTIIENKINLNLKKLVTCSMSGYKHDSQIILSNLTLEKDLLDFFNDRFRAWLKEQGFDFDVIDAVLSLSLFDFYDAYQRIDAVKTFKTLNEAESLAAANKRVANILQKNTGSLNKDIDMSLFEESAENELYENILEQENLQEIFLENKNKTAADYTQRLKKLAALKPAIDCFFDEVMVNAEDNKLRLNRLSLLDRLRKLFLNVADIAYLQKI